ncbi:ribose-5-phosphate isomerase [Gleimia sp. 6138-11-ORH1]|uniref:ribose-5-phosphate isomerase n=1 Tax=Gleimia sp. 6138-11-ORH1 TaxID=2973937 RepID=UPI0021677E9E|nr:ribose-5-phosphate isomerase [Gleimia sp. 6138-11-ORH1]MCS4484083.1 ribose-5-phosphate isomerase [Gleimia sp. 6138-11-ORH1]
MEVHIAADHAGFELREHLIKHLTEKGYKVIDHGATEYDALDAYPTMCIPCAEAVAKDTHALGIVIGGSGNGEQIAANKVNGVRAALAWSEATAALAREHNNANVIAVGARQHSLAEATRFIEVFLETPFSNDPRHIERINMLSDYETKR